MGINRVCSGGAFPLLGNFFRESRNSFFFFNQSVRFSSKIRDFNSLFNDDTKKRGLDDYGDPSSMPSSRVSMVSKKRLKEEKLRFKKGRKQEERVAEGMFEDDAQQVGKLAGKLKNGFSSHFLENTSMNRDEIFSEKLPHRAQREPPLSSPDSDCKNPVKSLVFNGENSIFPNLEDLDESRRSRTSMAVFENSADTPAASRKKPEAAGRVDFDANTTNFVGEEGKGRKLFCEETGGNGGKLKRFSRYSLENENFRLIEPLYQASLEEEMAKQKRGALEEIELKKARNRLRHRRLEKPSIRESLNDTRTASDQKEPRKDRIIEDSLSSSASLSSAFSPFSVKEEAHPYSSAASSSSSSSTFPSSPSPSSSSSLDFSDPHDLLSNSYDFLDEEFYASGKIQAAGEASADDLHKSKLFAGKDLNLPLDEGNGQGHLHLHDIESSRASLSKKSTKTSSTDDVLLPLKAEEGEDSEEILRFGFGRGDFLVDELKAGDKALKLPPDDMALQIELMKAKSFSHILSILKREDCQVLDAVHFSTAIHRLGKLSRDSKQHLIIQDEGFLHSLIDSGPSLIGRLDPQGLSNVFWGLVKLQFAPKWMPELLRMCSNNLANFKPNQVATCLHCLSKLNFPLKEAKALQEKLSARCLVYADEELEDSTASTVASLVTGLARLAIRDETLFSRLTKVSNKKIEEFETFEISAVCWALAKLSFSHPVLFKSIRRYAEQRIESFSARDIVQVAWSFSRLNEATSEFFQLTISPAVRTLISNFDVRDLCTIVWCYSNSGILDSDLFTDVSAILMTKIPNFSSHDISSISLSFALIEYSNKPLLNALKQQSFKLINTFSTRDLCAAVFGFGCGGLKDAKIYHLLCERAILATHMLSVENIVHLLVGLDEANYTHHPITNNLMNLVNQKAGKFFAEECIAVLKILGKLRQKEGANSMREDDAILIEKLLKNISQRSSSWMVLKSNNVADLLEAMASLGKFDAELLVVIFHRLSAYLEKSSKDEFLRILKAFSHIPPAEKMMLKLFVKKKKALQKKLSLKIAGSLSYLKEIEDLISIATSCVKIGYEDKITERVIEMVKDEIENSPDCSLSLESFANLIWTLTEMRRFNPWVRCLFRDWAKARYPAIDTDNKETKKALIITLNSPEINEDADSLLLLAWSCVCGGEEHSTFLPSLLEDVARLYLQSNKMPKQMLIAQQVALCATSSLSLGISQQARGFFEEILEFYRDDLMKKESSLSKKKKNTVFDEEGLYQFEKILQDSLKNMKITRCTYNHKILNTYSVPAAFLHQRQLIDVLSTKDILIPSGNILASSLLRQRQLSALGWCVHSVHMDDLIEALTHDKTVDVFLMKIVSSFFPETSKIMERFNQLNSAFPDEGESPDFIDIFRINEEENINTQEDVERKAAISKVLEREARR